MKEIQEESKERDFLHSTKTIYRDMDVLRSYGIRYDYREKAYILPMPSKGEQNISDIEWAMEKGVKISFKPFHYSTSRSTPKEYSNKGEPLEGSPWEIKTSNGKQYLYVYLGEKKGFLTYRTDRLDDIKVLTQPREGYAEYIKEKEQNHTKSEVKIFNGYRGKAVYSVKIRFINRLLEQVYDEFGRDVLIIREDDKHFTINRPISLSPTFYAWVATFGRSVKILSPKQAIKGMKKFIKAADDMYKEYNDDGEM